MLMTHLLAELYGCSAVIEDAEMLAAAAKSAARRVGATVVGEHSVRYVPHGLTIAVFLAESHIVLTTWPEHRLLLVDILLCNPAMDSGLVLEHLKARTCPHGELKTHHVSRKIGDSP